MSEVSRSLGGRSGKDARLCCVPKESASGFFSSATADKRIFSADANRLSLSHASTRPALFPPRRALLPARRFLHRSGAAGGAGADHARPFRPCALRPRLSAGDAADARHHGPALRRRISPARRRRPCSARRKHINGVSVTFHPAGHVLGSAQICVEHGGTRIVASGDYKRQPDATCLPFEPIRCDVFITEATFGLPVFRHPPDRHEIAKLLKSTQQFPERAHLVGAYALGKAQRVIRLLRDAGYDKPIFIHGALAKLCDYYQEPGHRPRRPSAGDRRRADRKAISPARSSSARRRPSPTAGRGAFPIRSPASRRAGCASASAPSRAASNCR